MIYVYILKSLRDSSQYVGMSGKIKSRLNDHNSGKVRSTKSKLPWKIIHTESFAGRAEARIREKYLKSAAGRRFRNTLRV